MKKRIIIAGPTASGKSSLAISLAQQIDGEVISVDSRQCYKQINIGTAKPSKNQLTLIPHHNISVLDLEKSDNVADFKVRVEEAAIGIAKKGKSVLFCGGSTLHLQSLIKPMDDIPSANSENLKTLQQAVNENGIESLYDQLLKHDPEYARSMDGFNKQRIMRALDVWMQTGRPFSSFHTRSTPEPSDDLLVFGLHRPRKILHERINRRVDRMIENGLVEETEQILADGYSPSLQSLQTVGYRDVISYLKRDVTREQMIADIKTQTRRYAKKQITWFRKWPFIRWMNAEEMTFREMLEQIQEFQNKT